jgi:hypothetical protein
MLTRKSNRILAFSMLALLILLSACAAASRNSEVGGAAADEGFAYGGTGGDFAGEMEEAPAAPAEPQLDADAVGQPSTGNSVDGQNQAVERLIIRTGNISVTVDDTEEVAGAIEARVNEMAGNGAFVVSTNVYGGSTDVSPQISMEIRVPAQNFDEVMDWLASLATEGTTPSISQTGQDVTEEYVDLAARLESLEAARLRLLEIMENSQTTEELLQAEAQLTQREAEIESIKGRMQYLEQSSDLSSITITLYPYILSQPVDTRWRPAETVREAFESLVESLRVVGDGLIFIAVFCGPWLIVIIPVLYFLIRFIRTQVRRRRERRAAAASRQTTP